MPAWDRAAGTEWGQQDIWCGCQVQLDGHSLEFSV